LIGKTLAHYEITELLGKGGMGEVYRARDSKLGREVAVKLLPPEFARDAERIARFRREARTLAGLNHTNIAAIYDLDEHEGHTFLTMELVEGDDLAQRLEAGPLDVEQATEFARQIAEGLEEAHEKDIVHRDLKPANVKITPEGRVKILDFGLARAYLGDPGEDGDIANSPTITQNFTAAGTILGTAAYMSPEQARGHALDSRSDIWAFGCVLFEMLSGTQTFSGDTVTDVLAGIVAREPDWDLLPEDTPAQVRSLLWRCLQKDPRQRLRHIGEASFYLNPPDPAMSSAMSAFIPEPTIDAPARRNSWIVPTLVGIGVGLILGFLGWRTVSNTGPVPERSKVARLSFSTGDYQPFSLRSWSALTVSPNGQTVIYSCTPRSEGAFGNRVLLAVRDLASREIRTIPGVSAAATPFFSPDGNQVAYFDFSQSALMSVRLEGGSPSQLATVDVGFTGGSWYQDDAILLTGSRGEGLYRLDLRTAEPELLLAVDPANDESSFSRPVVLVEHGLVLFTVFYLDVGRQPALGCLNLESGKRTDLGLGDAPLGLLPNGDLAYLKDSSILSQRFDPEGPSLSGAGKTLLEDSGPNVALSPTGTLVYTSGESSDVWEGRLFFVDDAGNVEDALDEPQEYARYPRISPDGRYLALTTGPGGRGTLWRYDLTRRSPPINLTFQDHNIFPVWSPDGSEILFQRSTEGSTGGVLQVIASDGSQMESRSIDIEALRSGGVQPGSWLSNGKAVVTRMANSETRPDIFEVDVIGEPAASPVVQTQFREGNTVMVSPDETWMAYASNRSGSLEIWVQGYPSGPAQRVSTGGGREPVWSRDGTRLYYQASGSIMVVDVNYAGPSAIEFSEPREFYDGPFIRHQSLTPRTYDAHPDGRLLMIERVDQHARADDIFVVLNWFEEFRNEGH
jgi:serine/threonine-protein kinase